MSAGSDSVSADVVVIGGGASGLPAALAAVEAGAKKVILLEKRKLLGGTGRMVGNVFAVESRLQKEEGLAYTADDLYQYHMERAHWVCDARLARNLITQSKHTLEWLEQKGAKFTRVVASTGSERMSHQIVDIAKGDVMPHTGNVIAQTLIAECKKKNVEILTDTRAVKLLRSDAGEVTGVLAAQGQREVRYDAKATIVATGSITGNEQLMRKYFPETDFRSNLRIAAGFPWVSGDGWTLTREVGALDDPVMTRLYVGPDCATSNSLMIVLHRPHAMLVNCHGLRFVDEALTINNIDHSMTGSAIERQPGNTCYAILTEGIIDEMIRRREVLCIFEEIFGQLATAQFFDVLEEGAESGPKTAKQEPTAWLLGLKKELRAQAEAGTVKVSDSLEELASWIGAEPETLRDQVRRYNQYCADGYDGEFLKAKEWLLPLEGPPYYAIKGGQLMDSVFGGVRINHEMNVLGMNHKAIRGLYAVGICTSGWLGPNGLGGVDGLCYALSVYSGITAGKNAAAFAAKRGKAQ